MAIIVDFDSDDLENMDEDDFDFSTFRSDMQAAGDPYYADHQDEPAEPYHDQEAEDFPAVQTTKKQRRGQSRQRNLALRQPILEDLRIAVLLGNAEAVKTIIATGTAVDAVLRNGWTALFTAAECAQVDIVKVLLEDGANVSFECDGYSVLMAACNSGSDDQKKVLACVRLLLEHGVDVNATEWGGISPLMYAASRGHDQLLEELLRSGATVNAADSNGWTALCWAAHTGHLSCVKVLLESGADPRQECNNGQRAEDLAYAEEHTELADYLEAVAEGQPSDELLEIAKHTVASHSYLEDTYKSTKHSVRFGDSTEFIQHLMLGKEAADLYERNLPMEELMVAGDEDLEKLGISQVGVRKKILESMYKLHLHSWQKAAPEAELQSRQVHHRPLSCMEVTAMLVNLQRHASLLAASVDYTEKQLQNLRAIPQSGSQNVGEELLEQAENMQETASVMCQQTSDLLAKISKVTQEVIGVKESVQMNQDSRHHTGRWLSVGVVSAALIATGAYFYTQHR